MVFCRYLLRQISHLFIVLASLEWKNSLKEYLSGDGKKSQPKEESEKPKPIAKSSPAVEEPETTTESSEMDDLLSEFGLWLNKSQSYLWLALVVFKGWTTAKLKILQLPVSLN